METQRLAALELLPAPPAGWRQKSVGLSLCMIVRDEEEMLPGALESVRGVVDEICIVDTGSVDRTPELAREAGALLRRTAWEDDFSKARNLALSMATRRWILVLDADERLAPSSRESLTALRARPAHLTGLWARCYNFTDDYKGTGAMSNAIVRVFPNHERVRYRNRLHEFVALDENASGMPAIVSGLEIIHLGYEQGLMLRRRKDERNLSLANAALSEAPGDPFNWYNYATSAMLAKQTAQAVAALEKMRELNAGRRQGFVPNGLVLLASLYLNERRDPARAEAVAREALELAPGFPDAHFVLGKALSAQRRYAEARGAYAAAIEGGKSGASHMFVDDEIALWKAHSEIGGTLMEEGGFDLALAWFDFALKQRPGVQPVRLNRARALERLERLDEAEAAFAEVWRDDRDELAANEYLNFLLRRGLEARALSFVESAAGALPPETRLIMLGSGAALALRLGRLAEARAHVARALALEGVEHRRERLTGLFRHFDDPRLLELLAEGTPAS